MSYCNKCGHSSVWSGGSFVCVRGSDCAGLVKASFTKKCELHNVFYSSDLSCKDCDKDPLNVKNILEILEECRSKDGALRLNSGKVQTREVDPAFILGIGQVLTASRSKYDHFNWAKPCKLSVPYESAMRHLMAFQQGEDLDPEDGCHHLLKVATNIMFMHYHITNNAEESDDRFFKGKKK